jgi:hypothetical protein
MRAFGNGIVRSGRRVSLLIATLIVCGLLLNGSRSITGASIVEAKTGDGWIQVEDFVPAVWPRGLKTEHTNHASRMEVTLPADLSVVRTSVLTGFRVKDAPGQRVAPTIVVVLVYSESARDTVVVNMPATIRRDNTAPGATLLTPAALAGGWRQAAENAVGVARRDDPVLHTYVGVMLVQPKSSRRIYVVEVPS